MLSSTAWELATVLTVTLCRRISGHAGSAEKNIAIKILWEVSKMGDIVITLAFGILAIVGMIAAAKSVINANERGGKR